MTDKTPKDKKGETSLFPHDRYIRSVMTNPRVVKDFFSRSLPPDIRSQIDLSTLQPQQGSYVDDKLKLLVTDLLYAVDIQGEPGFLYLLCEHASKPDRILPFRMDRYISAIQHHHLSQQKGKKTLPVVYPMIIYTGKRLYTHSLDRFDLYGKHKDLAREIASKPYHLIDLTHSSDEELEAYGWFRVAALLFKYVHNDDVRASLVKMIKLFREIFRDLEMNDELEYIYSSLSYFCEVVELDRIEFVKVMAHGLEGADKEKIMTIAEQFRAEGFKQGVEKGIQEGIQEGIEKGVQLTAHRMLAEDLPLDVISKITGISVENLKKIKH